MKSFRFLLLFVLATSAAAQTTITGSLRLRSESWSWFATPAADDRYTFFASQLRVAATHKAKTHEESIEIEQTTLLGLPDKAVLAAPKGQLGLGGAYFAANDNHTGVAGLFVRQAFVKWKWPKAWLEVGRFDFADGAETTPSNPLLAALKRERVAQRLIGAFGFSHVGRSFDGVQAAGTLHGANLTGVIFRPTKGVFYIDGSGEVDGVTVGYGAATWSAASSDTRLFAAVYRDSRDILKTDNRPAAVRSADHEHIEITTIGGHYLRVIPLANGDAEVVAWAALQRGDWSALRHKADAIAIESGFHWRGDKAPALRAGWFRGSGDDDPTDRRHGTFVPLLTTPRVYARFPFYNTMNSNDLFLQGSIKTTPKLTVQSELHRLRLASAHDLWYSGGGAFDDKVFGFNGRPSSGSGRLAHTADLSLDYRPNAKSTITLYCGQAFGSDVARTIFAGSKARLAYLELNRRF